MQQAGLDPASDKTYASVGALLDEVTALFPDAYFHVGGDEVTPKAERTGAVSRSGYDPCGSPKA